MQGSPNKIISIFLIRSMAGQKAVTCYKVLIKNKQITIQYNKMDLHYKKCYTKSFRLN